MTRHLPLAADDDDLCVARVPLFRGLSRQEQQHVAELARPLRLHRDEQVYAAGADVPQLMVVHTGRLKTSRISPDGHEQIVRVLGPGDFVGETSFLTGARPDHHATALEPGSVCVFRHADLARLVEHYPSIGLRMLEAVSRRLADTEDRLAALTTADVGARLAGYLLSLPGRHAQEVLTVTLPLPKKDVASLLDTTPESLSRQLRRLQDRGVLEAGPGRQIRLLDVDALQALAGS